MVVFVPVFLIAVGYLAFTADSTVPCSDVTYRTLNQEWRNVYRAVDTSAGGHCDASIDDKWYRFVNSGGDDMPVTAPTRGYCGTYNPVWLNGSLPTVAEGQVTRSACLVTTTGPCEEHWDIQVKNCSGFYIYYLQPTPSCPAAYCIGTRKKCDAGDFSGTGYEPCYTNATTPVFNGTAKMTIEVGSKIIVTTIASGKTSLAPVNIYRFNCTAPPVVYSAGRNTNFTILYRYEWVMKGITLIVQDLPEQNFKYITEDELKDAYYLLFPSQPIMGNYLNCRISVGTSILNGWYSDIVETSSFLGIKILTPSVTLYKGQAGADSAYVQLNSTIPILCQDPTFSSCFLYFQTLIPKPPAGNILSCQGQDYLDDVVFQNHITGTPCSFAIPAANWTQTVNFKVLASSLSGYTSDTRSNSWKLRLQVVNNTGQPLWRYYTIGEVTVFVIDNSNVRGYNPNAYCYAANDPHMKTFDDKYYEMQQPGEYVMYRHTTLPILVHGFFVPVDTSTGTNVYSYTGVCGFAVQSGSDLIVHDACDGSKPKRIRVYGCSDYGLKEDIQGTTHTVILPTGTIIVLSPGRITITASILDFKQTSGLCGTFDGNSTNDMVLKDGSYSKTSDFSDFAQSWRILSNIYSLFFGQTLQTLPSWKSRQEHYCVCRATGEAPSCSYTTDVDTKYCATYNKQSKDPNLSSCLAYKKRSTASSDNVEYEEPTEIPDSFNTPVVMDTSWKNGWDEQNATNFCINYLTSVTQFSACASFNDTNIQSRIHTCILDVKISGTTTYSDVHKNIMLDVCQNIYQNNQSLWSPNISTGAVELPSILSSFCPSDCSGHGKCINGSCVCDAGYTNTDCSGNLTHVPVLFPLPTNGLCDSSQRACFSTTVFADQFLDTGNLSCLLQEFVVSVTGKISTYFTSTKSAMFYHDQKVACTLPTVQSNLTGNTLGYGFKISVANTANAYSSPKDLVVYDGNCVTCSSDQVCVIKDRTCVINGICFMDNYRKPGSTSLKCDSSVNKWDWTNGCSQPTLNLLLAVLPLLWFVQDSNLI